MKTNSIAALALIFVFLTANNVSQTKWQRTIGGANDDGAYTSIQTTDGGYVMAGYTRSFGAGGDDLYIVKLDAAGSLQWSRTIGGANYEWVTSIIQTTDGGYAAAGATWSFGAGSGDMYIVKLNSGGNLEWNRTVGGVAIEWAGSIIQIADGSYIVAGGTTTFGAGSWDFYVVKLDAGGTLQWSKTIGGFNPEIANSIIQTTDGGYIVAGETGSFGAGSNDICIVKLDSGCNIQWSRTFGGIYDDDLVSMIQTADGGYAAAGYTESFGAGQFDFYIIKLNGGGTLQWTKTFGGTGDDEAGSVIQTPDGGYTILGSIDLEFEGDFCIVKLDGSGSLQWSRKLGGTGIDYGSDIIKTADGGYVTTGSTGSFGAGGLDFYIVKLDANWNTCGNSSPIQINTGTGGTTTAPSPTVTTPASIVMTPVPVTSSGGMAASICTFVGIQQSNEIPDHYQMFQNYPNPFNPDTKIKFQISKSGFAILAIYDVNGKEITTLINEQLNPGTYEVNWHAANYPSGVYFYKLIAGEYKETKKMILIK